jgi:signal transduction histidine kinase
MSLRNQLLALFAALAVVPLLAIGVVDYVRSIDALERLIGAQTGVIAEDTANEVADRYSAINAHVALLAGNSVVTSYLDTPSHETRHVDSIGRAYLRELGDLTRPMIARVNFHDATGRLVPTLGDLYGETADRQESVYLISQVITSPSGGVLGRMHAAIKVNALIPRDLINRRFGRHGWTAIADIKDGSYLATSADVHPRHAVFDARDGVPGDRRTFKLNDSVFIATIASVPGSPFRTVSIGSVDEFSTPFARIRTGNLALVVATTTVVSLLFLLLLWRATHALSVLRTAADEVGRGNLTPTLPPARADEVGTLSAAFAMMTNRLRETLAEMDRSRKMAAIGAFASEVSHEIRNPLTTIKLNLQVLERAAERGQIGTELHEPLRLTLKEAQRLDKVVRGVLQLGQGKVQRTQTFRLGDAASSVVESMRGALAAQHVTVSYIDAMNGERIRGDRQLVEAAVMNLVVNAAEAMPNGGRLSIVAESIAYDGTPVARLRVEDTGVGIPVAMREKVFAPFFTTKSAGSGLGLALVHRTVEDHAGRAWISGRADGAPGTAVVVELPVEPEPA